jgi:hypothetical protein
LLCRLTLAPTEGAGPFNVTVPIDGEPPTADDGRTVTLNRVAGLIVRGALSVTAFNVPEIVTAVTFATPVVAMVNEAVVEPAGITIEEGKEALPLVEFKLTISPPAGAGPLRVTFPVEEAPPRTVFGATVKPTRSAESMVKGDVIETLPWVAVIFATTVLGTPIVVTINVAVLEPAATVT